MYPNTSDLDDDFFPRLQDVADELVARPLDLAKVMFSESGLHHDAWNNNPKELPPAQRYNASGTTQMMPATLLELGWSAGHAAYRALSATDQNSWVERYFRPYRGLLVSVGAIYTANFLPALVPYAGNPDFELVAKGGVMGWAYGPNASFDANGDARITVRELALAVERNCSGPRWAEIVKRLTGEDVSPELANFELGTVQGLQQALGRLGYDVGTVDGIPGRKTHDALYQFQSQRGLKADGIYGPLTRAALQMALDTAQ